MSFISWWQRAWYAACAVTKSCRHRRCCVYSHTEQLHPHWHSQYAVSPPSSSSTTFGSAPAGVWCLVANYRVPILGEWNELPVHCRDPGAEVAWLHNDDQSHSELRVHHSPPVTSTCFSYITGSSMQSAECKHTAITTGRQAQRATVDCSQHVALREMSSPSTATNIPKCNYAS